MSSFHLNRFGLMNFWYHSDTVFEFTNGRLFIRGGNGSGKSVSSTMAIPFLLDGDKRPSKLDPFGSQDRRMIDLLLGNKHISKREEGIGYLYMEYRKENTFVTVGIGLNGKRQESDKTMRTWYFVLHNKRIGHDIQLYDEKVVNGTLKKFPLNMGDLTDRIGIDGEVTDNQKRYVELVNQEIYRFRTTQEFKELISVLLQLRSPKLSNAVKASEVSNVLSDALPELSHSDLMPLSSSLESMDNLKEKQMQYENELTVLTTLMDAYDTYNNLSLYEKAKHLVTSEKQFNESTKLMNDYKATEAVLIEDKTKLERLQTEQIHIKETMQKKIISLQGHPIFTLEQELDQVKLVLKRLKEKLAGKSAAIEKNMLQQQSVTNRIRQGEVEEYKTVLNRQDRLLDLDRLADEAKFSPHATWSKHFKTSLESFSAAGFKNWQEVLTEYSDKVQEVANRLHSLQLRIEHEDQKQRILRTEEDRVSQIELESQNLQKEITLGSISIEKAVVSWAKNAKTFKIQTVELLEAQEILQGIGDFLDDVTPSTLSDWLNHLYTKRYQAFQNEKMDLKVSIRYLEAEIKKIEMNIESLSGQIEMTPPLPTSETEEVKRLLAEEIRVAYFYEAIEFNEYVPPIKKAAIEGAIARSGLLTALIVHESDRPKVAASMTVVQKGTYKKLNLLSYMCPIPINGLTEEDIIAILQTISVMPHEEGYILETGEFRSGMVGGKAPQYEDAYIGRSAREQIRDRKIGELQKLRDKIKHQKDVLESNQQSIENQKQILVMEQEMFPSLSMLIDLLKKYETNDLERKLRLNLVEQLQADLRIYRNETQIMRNDMYYVAQELKFPLEFSTYKKASNSLESYKVTLSELYIVHNTWLNVKNSLSDLSTEKEVTLGVFYNLENEKQDLEDELQKNLALELMYIDRIHKLDDIDVQQEIILARNTEHKAEKQLESYRKKINELDNKLYLIVENQKKEQPARDELLLLLNAWNKLYLDEISLGLVSPPKDASLLMRELEETNKGLSSEEVLLALKDAEAHSHRALKEYGLKQKRSAITLEIQSNDTQNASWVILKQHCSRQFITFSYQHVENTPRELFREIEEKARDISSNIQEEEQHLFEKVLIDVVGTAIHEKVRSAKQWVKDANAMLQRVTGTIQMRLEWVPLNSKEEEQISTNELLTYLSKESIYLTPSQKEKVRLHFKSKIDVARKKCKDDTSFSMYEELKRALDYRQWYRFDMFITRKGIPEERFSNKVFGELSGGEKAMSVYSPLFAAIAAKYSYASPDAPRIISLDEAFAGIDSENIAQMFQLVHDFEFDYIMNSQVLWGCYETVDELSIAHILRPVDSPVLAIARYYWDGKFKHTLP